MSHTIRRATPNDAEAIVNIYNHYITDTVITFEELAMTGEQMRERMATVMQRYPWLVLEEEGKVVGYSYATEWKTRSAYRFTVEAAVYLHKNSGGKGHGTALYNALMPLLKEQGIHLVIGGITLPNKPSIALHEKLGFKYLGKFTEVGKKFNQWHDVGYWELNLAHW